MVTFSVFNELSLPLDKYTAEDKFGCFFAVLKALKKHGLGTVRMSEDFKNYNILHNVTFSQFLGQQNHDLKIRLKSFIANGITKITSPIIHATEQEQQNILGISEYFYNSQPIDGGLACADIWNTLAVSFNTQTEWDKDNISIQKGILDKNDTISHRTIRIKHVADVKHIDNHRQFFNDLETESKLGITRENIWQQRRVFFPEVIVFCPEVKAQIKKLDKIIFDQAISILRDIEMERKSITDFNCSGEGQTVKNDPQLRRIREFTVDGTKVFFNNHIKSLSDGYRIHFLQKGDNIHIGYIGKHLKTANH